MERFAQIWLALVLLTVASCGEGETLPSTPRTQAAPTAGHAPVLPGEAHAGARRAGSADQVVHVDPEPGRRSGRPPLPDPAFEKARRALMNRSTEGLVEEWSPHSGTLVRLHGRFRSAAVAVTTPDGETQSTCGPAPAPWRVVSDSRSR